MSASSVVQFVQSFVASLHPRRAQWRALFAAVLAGIAASASAQVQTASGVGRTVANSVPAAVLRAADAGRLNGSTTLPHLALSFSMTDTQKADLKQLLHDQQDKGSPLFHRWLTPLQYQQRFGRSSAETAAVASWLQSQGFSVEQSTPLSIGFSGTAAEVEAAFKTQLHQYTLGSQRFYSNATNVTLPASFGSMVAGIAHLNSIRPNPQFHRQSLDSVRPNLTTTSGSHYVVPADIQTIYNVNSLYGAGYTGAGQNLVVVGQSAIDTADIDNFHTMFGGNSNLILTLVPFTGDSAVLSDDDEEESDLDIEYSGSTAKDATVNFVYVGNDSSSSVFDAVQYAIQYNLAPIISISYGACENDLDSFTVSYYSTFFDEAVAQGQTLIAASGDSGATACDRGNYEAYNGLAVQFPSDSPDITGVGGTEFNEASGTYWNTTDGTGEGSALSYIPEMAWNDSTGNDYLSAGGGGVSTFFTKPAWQSGAGVPNDGARDIPDVSLDSSGEHDGYFFCGPPDVDGNNCSNGYVYVGGGTSFAAPIFAGIMTLVNQAAAATGQGNINPLLYPMAANTPAAFHDITVGSNDSPCAADTTDCPDGTTEIGYSAGTGYDLATGLGSVDALTFAQAFPGYGGGTPLSGSLTKLTYTPSAPNAGSSITLTATVSPSSTSATGTPSGTVQFLIDGDIVSDLVAITNGSATYESAPLSAGTHMVTAQYSGDTSFGSSATTLTLPVAALPATSTVVTLSPAVPTVGTALTVTAQIASATPGVFTGTIDFVIDGNDTDNPITIANGSATLAVPALTAGAHAIQAQYSGDSNFSASTGQVSFTVAALTPGTVTVSVTPATPSTSDTLTVNASLPQAATGSVQFVLDGVDAGSPATVSGGVATASLGTLPAGSHTIAANYLGDATFSAAAGEQSFVVSSTSAAFSLHATDVALSSGQSGESTVTVTSVSDYAGTVQLAISGSGPSNSCYVVSKNPTLAAGGSATSAIAIYTGTSCTVVPNARHIGTSAQPQRARNQGFKDLTFAGVFGVLLFGLRRRRAAWRVLAGCLALAVAGFAVGCGGDSKSATTSPAGSYTLTVTGIDSVTGANTATTTFTLTVQ